MISTVQAARGKKIKTCTYVTAQAAHGKKIKTDPPRGRASDLHATPISRYIEVLNVNPRHKKAIILLLYRTDVKVLKDALEHLGPYQTLTSVRYSDPYG